MPPMRETMTQVGLVAHCQLGTASDAVVGACRRVLGESVPIESVGSKNSFDRLSRAALVGTVLMVADGSAAKDVVKRLSDRQAKNIVLICLGTPEECDLPDAYLRRFRSAHWMDRSAIAAFEQRLTDAIRDASPTERHTTIQSKLTEVAANLLANAHRTDAITIEYLRLVQRLLGVSALGIYAGGATKKRMRLIVGVGGTGLPRSIDIERVGGEVGFKDSVTIHRFSDSGQLGVDTAASSYPLVVATELGWGDSQLATCFSFAARDGVAMDALVLHAANEIFGLFKSEQLVRRIDTLEGISRDFAEADDRSSALWACCNRLQAYFACEAASVIRVLTDDGDELEFEKYFTHHGRKEKQKFRASHGFAHHVVRNRKALVVTSTSASKTGPIGECLEFELDAVSSSAFRPLTLETFEAPGSVEVEQAILYLPILAYQAGAKAKAVGVVKIANLEQADVFSFSNFSDLRSLAGPITSYFATSYLSDRLASTQSLLGLKERIAEHAPTLFYYRHTALGMFHQVGHVLGELGFDLMDLRNSLAAKLSMDDELVHAVDDVHGKVNAAKGLVSSAMRRGKSLQPIRESVHLIEDVVRPSIDYARRQIKSPKWQIRTFVGRVEYEVVGDEQLLRETLMSLVGNAIHAIRANLDAGQKKLSIAVRPTDDGRTIRVFVSDTGVGMIPEVAAMAFTPYFTTKGDEGSGLGLYFARQLLQKFSGDVTLQSTVPGKGSRFVISLPIKRKIT
jgi:signal transduction histidine kinase